MLWIAIVLFLAALLVIGFTRGKAFRRHKTRYRGDSGHSPQMVVGDSSPVYICDADAANWGGGDGHCGSGDGGGSGD